VIAETGLQEVATVKDVVLGLIVVLILWTIYYVIWGK